MPSPIVTLLSLNFRKMVWKGELDDLYVLPGFQNRGIGSAILQRCITMSAKPLYLYVFSRNIRAISFYERFGFCVQKTIGNTRLIMARNG